MKNAMFMATSLSMSLPAFGERCKAFRMLFRLATLMKPTSHLLVHPVRQSSGVLAVHPQIHLNDLHQLSHDWLSRLEGPFAAQSRTRRTGDDEGTVTSCIWTEGTRGGTGIGLGDGAPRKEGPEPEAMAGSP